MLTDFNICLSLFFCNFAHLCKVLIQIRSLCVPDMFQKLSSVEEHRDWLVDCNVHKVIALSLCMMPTDVSSLHIKHPVCYIHWLIPDSFGFFVCLNSFTLMLDDSEFMLSEAMLCISYAAHTVIGSSLPCQHCFRKEVETDYVAISSFINCFPPTSNL